MELKNLWFSAKQAEILTEDGSALPLYKLIIPADHNKEFLNKEIEVTEASDFTTPPGKWNDFVYLGKGYYVKGTLHSEDEEDDFEEDEEDDEYSDDEYDLDEDEDDEYSDDEYETEDDEDDDYDYRRRDSWDE